MLPSVDSLRCFIAAAKTLNFRAASRTVALTPAAFGHRIRQLEDELGESLFMRTTRSVRLSTFGLALLPVAQRAIASVEECVRVGQGAHQFPHTAIVLGTRHELGLSWLLPQVDRLMNAHAWLDLNLYFGSGSDLVNRVRNVEVDCAVVSIPIHDPQLEGLRLHEERYLFVAAPELLKNSPLRSKEQSVRHTLIDIDDELPLYRYWRDAPQAPSLTFAKLARFGTIAAIRQRVIDGAGIAVLPEYLIRADLRAKRLRPLFPQIRPLTDHFRLVFRKDDSRRPMFEMLARSMSEFPLQ